MGCNNSKAVDVKPSDQIEEQAQPQAAPSKDTDQPTPVSKPAVAQVKPEVVHASEPEPEREAPAAEPEPKTETEAEAPAAEPEPKAEAPAAEPVSKTEPETEAPAAETEPEPAIEVPVSEPEPEAQVSEPKVEVQETADLSADALKAAIAKEDQHKELLQSISSIEGLRELWGRADFNGNGGCSLAELDKMVEEKGWNLSKPTLIRAYKKTTLTDGDGDPWVEKKEFAAFIQNAFFIEQLWGVFDDLDADDDRRIELDEFKAGMAKLGCVLSDEQAVEEFGKIDTNNGGKVLFVEFCQYIASIIGIDMAGDKEKWENDA